ncbi:natural resistance-associated macrophage protein-domain-containing protein [Gymnopilus junonius]|uniref:Natural resistance-associated macrophage protein-domain-containing protein n=1 Tax=Gymnopilus junonius TaxID=109634 RepID=A0A9P5NKP1_GYMJU|nr:natural resistance-associated macrophage protein-domain-containing protein [Gymnopilus junonius]
MADSTTQQQPKNGQRYKAFLHNLKRATIVIINHAKKHAGVGVVCAVAYFDPGNWGVDLQAGSQFGYSLLFVVLLSGLFAVYLQVLASRLGCVTGIDLASHTRLLLYSRPKHTLLYRWLGLYPLYILSEVAIIATDLAELLGSAIALCLLFPRLELWHGVLITAFDVVFILAMGDPLRGKPVKAFEILIGGMVIAILVCMIVIIAKVNVNWGYAFKGFLPSSRIFAQGGLYTSVGILGATVMPHSIYLGSALATQDRISFRAPPESKEVEETKEATHEQPFMARVCATCKNSLLTPFRRPPPNLYSSPCTQYCDHQNNSYAFVRAHIYHATTDMVGSLLGFAVMINSLILILASAVFYYGHSSSQGSPAGLFEAYDLIRDIVGQGAATLFAIALLCAGQSSSLIATVAGQAICEGFLTWRVSAVTRRLFTRFLAIIPSMAVAIVVGKPGIDTLLVASQVVLSIVLPFVIFPLLLCTSSKSIMSVRKDTSKSISQTLSSGTVSEPGPSSIGGLDKTEQSEESQEEELVDYSNNKLTIALGMVIWLVIAAANVYVIVELGLGNSG